MSITPQSAYAKELDFAVLAVSEAARAVRDFYDRAETATYEKADGSEVTDADLAADRIIRTTLTAQFPGDPILTEEGADDMARLSSARCWIADPIDGTVQFIKRTGDFDILVALVVDGRPVVAAGCNPPSGLICAAETGQGAWIREADGAGWQQCVFEPVPAGAGPRLATSIWFGAPDNHALVRRIAHELGTDQGETLAIGFSPRIFLPGKPADAYLGIKVGSDQSMAWEWDFVTADLFIHEAGGKVTDLAGLPHQYNKPHTRNLNGLIAARDPLTHDRVRAATESAGAAKVAGVS